MASARTMGERTGLWAVHRLPVILATEGPESDVALARYLSGCIAEVLREHPGVALVLPSLLLSDGSPLVNPSSREEEGVVVLAALERDDV